MRVMWGLEREGVGVGSDYVGWGLDRERRWCGLLRERVGKR